jgi:hypothetical protein
MSCTGVTKFAYKAKMARRAAPMMLPNATPVEEPLLARSGAVGAAVLLPPVGAATGTVAMVVGAVPELPETGVVSAGTAAGVPTTRTGTAAVAVPDGAAVGVENTTWGTVMTVEIAVVVEEDGMIRPEETPVDSTHGTVMVDTKEMVVTGMLATGATGAGVTDGEAVAPGISTDDGDGRETAGTETDGAPEAETVVAAAGGATLGHPVMIAGFWGMYGAQIPWK